VTGKFRKRMICLCSRLHPPVSGSGESTCSEASSGDDCIGRCIRRSARTPRASFFPSARLLTFFTRSHHSVSKLHAAPWQPSRASPGKIAKRPHCRAKSVRELQTSAFYSPWAGLQELGSQTLSSQQTSLAKLLALATRRRRSQGLPANGG
jgi:hypothetical protein